MKLRFDLIDKGEYINYTDIILSSIIIVLCYMYIVSILCEQFLYIILQHILLLLYTFSVSINFVTYI